MAKNVEFLVQFTIYINSNFMPEPQARAIVIEF